MMHLAQQPIKRKTERSGQVKANSLTTYLSDSFVLCAHDAAYIVAQACVANVLTLEEVLSHNLVYFLLRVARKTIPLHVELDDALVGHQTAFERRCIALVDLVRGDVELLNGRVVTDVLGETFAEHVSEQVGCQVDLF